MTKRLWFQVGIGIIISLIIIKFLVEVMWIFSPVGVVVKSIFIPLLIGGVIYYVSLPLQAFLEKYKFPRWSSIAVTFLILIGLLWAAFAVIGPPVGDQVDNLVENSPEIINSVNEFAVDISSQIDYLPEWIDVEKITKKTNEWVEKFSPVNFGNWFLQFFQSIVQGTIQGAIIIILVPFFLFFMLKDHERFVPFVIHFFSGKTKIWLEKTLRDIDNVLSLYIRGQVLISVILAIMLYIGYSLIGLKFALLLSVFALFMNIIPFIGPWIAFIPALIIAVFQDPTLVIWVSVVTLVAQQTDAQLITPNVMGKTLNIHPLTIITVLISAGKIAGFFGILLAVPAYAVGKTIVTNIYERRKDIKDSVAKTI